MTLLLMKISNMRPSGYRIPFIFQYSEIGPHIKISVMKRDD
jgi:hypothetical protein